MNKKYVLLADDVQIWQGEKQPSYAETDKVISEANKNGWDGCVVELCEIVKDKIKWIHDFHFCEELHG